MPYMELVGMVMGRLGARPAQSKIIAVAQLKAPGTVEQVKSLLGMITYLRRFVPGFSAMAAPIPDLPTDKCYASKGFRKERVAWGAE